MVQYEAFDSSVEVNGQTVLSVIEGVPSAFEQKASRILAENGIEDPQPDQWYSQQTWLNAFSQVDANIGESTLNQIGKSIPNNSEWPKDVDSVVGGLESINQAYQMNHRGGDIGHYEAETVDKSTAHVECTNPYACAFDTGIVKAVAQKFTDSGVLTITEIGDECRAESGDSCLYEISW